MAKKDSYAQMIDHTLLKPQASQNQIEALCEEAIFHKFKSVCVQPYYVPFCATRLRGQIPLVCTVIGFPSGTHTTQTKAFEAEQAMKNGAVELDMVINISALKSGDWRHVENDISQVVQAAPHARIKVILETCLLDDREKVTACKIAENAGAHFVKTSTGFAGGGATPGDVALMRQSVSESLEVKASGGIGNLAGMEAMLAAGATRIGASAGVAIMEEIAD